MVRNALKMFQELFVRPILDLERIQSRLVGRTSTRMLRSPSKQSQYTDADFCSIRESGDLSIRGPVQSFWLTVAHKSGGR